MAAATPTKNPSPRHRLVFWPILALLVPALSDRRQTSRERRFPVVSTAALD
jgi:hypothetical protein